MARRLVRLFLLLAGFVLVVSGTVHAQSAISGAVRDTSGALMPGVSVEVASPVLIEKVRAAVTDELSALPGVTQASVEVVRDGESVISVVADRELGTEEISGALDEAGDYHLVR